MYLVYLKKQVKPYIATFWDPRNNAYLKEFLLIKGYKIILGFVIILIFWKIAIFNISIIVFIEYP